MVLERRTWKNSPHAGSGGSIPWSVDGDEAEAAVVRRVAEQSDELLMVSVRRRYGLCTRAEPTPSPWRMGRTPIGPRPRPVTLLPDPGTEHTT